MPADSETKPRRGRPSLPPDLRRLYGPRLMLTKGEHVAIKRGAHRACLPLEAYVRHRALHSDLGAMEHRRAIPILRRHGQVLNDHVYGYYTSRRIVYDAVLTNLNAIHRTASHLHLSPGKSIGLRVKDPPEASRREWGRLRATAAERRSIRERARSVGLSQTAFVRRAALQRPLGALVARQLIRELCRVENNLNQLYVLAGRFKIVPLGDVATVLHNVSVLINSLGSTFRR